MEEEAVRKENREKPFCAGLPPSSPPVLQLELPGAIRLPSLRSRPPALAKQGRR